MASFSPMDAAVLETLQRGVVIPAHPLALTANRQLDERRQVALTRYYCDAGAGGVAVGVHTTQFAIRDPRVGLYAPVLRLAAATVAEFERASGKPIVKVAGVCGVTAQAVREAA
ncbi:MAG: dihydrodipicolinate synthase family protein, partial [Candidatus Solibacter sp.]|nr:dihydrodipicolinate synthase family protein [Candidatus Solibacter sp.]